MFLNTSERQLNLVFQDSSSRFSISLTSTSVIFQKWLNVTFIRLQFFISWPTREVRQNMPPLFKQFYPHCVVIIDCSEIFIDTPSQFEARSKTYSNYKKHNTVKFLIGITPCGSISFLSQCWGGRVSDKNLTQQCGFLSKLQHGDVVLADRGFTIEEDVAVYGAKLEIPAFTRGKTSCLRMKWKSPVVSCSYSCRKSNRLVKEQIQYHQRSHTHNLTETPRRYKICKHL